MKSTLQGPPFSLCVANGRIECSSHTIVFSSPIAVRSNENAQLKLSISSYNTHLCSVKEKRVNYKAFQKFFPPPRKKGEKWGLRAPQALLPPHPAKGRPPLGT